MSPKISCIHRLGTHAWLTVLVRSARGGRGVITLRSTPYLLRRIHLLCTMVSFQDVFLLVGGYICNEHAGSVCPVCVVHHLYRDFMLPPVPLLPPRMRHKDGAKGWEATCSYIPFRRNISSEYRSE